ncbi:MAG: hypothetical protein K0V04_38750 [Deltaproteobacteria bacterium]|nr:hypothetical protein [Deltaproteobacteria bacterium]
MPTLVEHLTEIHKGIEPLEEDARKAFAKAKVDERDAKREFEEAVGVLKTADEAIARIQGELGAVVVPAEATELVEQLEAALVERRKAHTARFDARVTMLKAEQASARTGATSARLTAALATVAGELEAAKEREAKVQGWKDLVTDGLLSTFPGALSALKEEMKFDEAKALYESPVLPGPLRTRIKDRMLAVLADDATFEETVRHREDLSDAVHESENGSRGPLPAKRRALARAEKALENYVTSVQLRAGEASGRIAKIRGRSLDEIQQSDVPEALESTSERDAALAAEEARDATRLDRDVALRALTNEKTRLRSIDPDDPLDSPAVNELQNGLNDAEEALNTANDDGFTAEMQALLSAWEVQIPEVLWNNIGDFVVAKFLLEQIATVVPSDLADAVTEKESELVTALAIEDTVERRLALTTDLIDEASDARTLRLSTKDDRLWIAMRGETDR